MARSKEQDAGTIRWYSLLSPERRMERRVRARAFLDAFLNVQGRELAQHMAGPGEQRADGFYYAEAEAEWCPATIGEIAGWVSSTVHPLGALAQTVVGEHNARVGALKVHIGTRDAAHTASPQSEESPTEKTAGPLKTGATASDPAAQALRRTRLATQARAAEEARDTGLRAELAEALALRAAAVRPLRETALQTHAFGVSLMSLYWGVRQRWSRPGRGTAPVAAYIVLPLADWVTDDTALFDVTSHSGGEAAAA